MNRNECFQALTVAELTLRLAWASLTLQVDETEDIQVLVSGSEDDVASLRLACQDGRLTVEQPSYGLNMHQLHGERWMQVTLRLPRHWKGAVDASTISSPLQASGLTGTDLALGTVSGSMQVCGLQSIHTALHSVSGSITAHSLQGEKLSLRTVSGPVSLAGCDFETYKLGSVSAPMAINMLQGFDKLEGATVSGSISITSPLRQVDAALRTVSGRLLTQGVSIGESPSVVRISSVSANIEMNCSQVAAIDEEE